MELEGKGRVQYDSNLIWENLFIWAKPEGEQGGGKHVKIKWRHWTD